MGLYDEVVVTCPKCQSEVLFQTKAGPCELNKFSLDDAPFEVRADLIGQDEKCPCGATITIHGELTVWVDI